MLLSAEIPSKLCVSPKAFSAIQCLSTDELSLLTESELRPLLPCLVRMALCAPLDQSSDWVQKRKIILQLLSGIELVNSVVALLSVDFHVLEVEVKKELQLRCKFGGHSGESVLMSSFTNGPALEFERSDAAQRLRLVLGELLVVMTQVKEGRLDGIQNSELFESTLYLEEIADVLCIAQAELPGLLPFPDIVESLLYIKNGICLLCRLVANSPDCFREVCTTLIINGDKQNDESVIGKIRMHALRTLCQMNTSQRLSVRGKAVEFCRMPGLTIILTLDYCHQDNGNFNKQESVVGDLVAFVSGLLLGSDNKLRNWFGQYLRNCQKETDSDGCLILSLMREELLQRLKNLVHFSIPGHEFPDIKVVQASSLLRLYCALRGIASLKFNDEEINLILQLLTSQLPPSPPGIRLLSISLCMLLACPTLLGTIEQEKRAIDWIQWLLKEENYFGSTSGVKASFGEMVLLIAIHFHCNQISSIADLVCSTLGMQIVIRSNTLTRMKTIFTQEICTDQVVTALAVKVPVTSNLSREVNGFLPVHCIHQLLKSRAFTKHKVPIKDWIYKQVCNTVPPLHPLLPGLIEVYVNSVLTPSSKGSYDTTNEPITEDEILAVFSKSAFVPQDQLSVALNNKSSVVSMDTGEASSSLTSQLLILYYLLLYEDTRLSNMKNIVISGRKVKRYSPEVIANIPIFYLIQRAQKDQQQFSGLFSPLLRLLVTHFPDLCVVQSWLAQESNDDNIKSCKVRLKRRTKEQFTLSGLDTAFREVKNCPFQLMSYLDHLLSLPVQQLWTYASKFVMHLPMLLETDLQILVKAKDVWWKLNSVFPRRLWVMTVNAFRCPPKNSVPLCKLTLDDIVVDPLHVLRCDQRIFKCPPLMEILLLMLQAFLAASRTHLTHHTLENPLIEKVGQLECDKDREDLLSTLVSTQESAAVQILLEICKPTKEEEKSEGLLNNLREIQGIVCSHLHQVFISNPGLAKVVHFQIYPSELLPIVVSSVPSLHICLDFLPELLRLADLEKQVFGIELASYLCLQYAIPKSLIIAKLCIDICHTMLVMLNSNQQVRFFLSVLPALVRMCRAFPPICEDVANLLTQLARISFSHICATCSILPTIADLLLPVKDTAIPSELEGKINDLSRLDPNEELCQVIQKSYFDLCSIISLNKTIF